MAGVRLPILVAATTSGAFTLVVRAQQELAVARVWLHDGAMALQGFMAANWLAFGAGQVLVAASGVLPASMIAMMAGASLGFLPGLALSAVATLLGGWIAFVLCRTALRGWIAKLLGRHPAMTRLDAAITGEGWRMVALLRVSPVMPFALTSYGIGLTRISQRDFLLGTLASLPALVGYVALGALGRQGVVMAEGGASLWRFVALGLGVAVVFYASFRVKQAVGRLALA